MAGGGWSVEERLAGIPAQGDPLERLAATVGFAVSRARPVLARARGGRRRWKGGRPGFDPVLEFRALGLQSLHGPSLEATGHPVRDRTRDSAPPAPIVGGPEGSGWRSVTWRPGSSAPHDGESAVLPRPTAITRRPRRRQGPTRRPLILIVALRSSPQRDHARTRGVRLQP